MRALSLFTCASVLALLPLGSLAACVVQSGAQTRALVELYTSEGCSSCPPADKRLGQLPSQGPSAAIPIALHVDYWDYIGWKDPYARAEFGLRQKTLARANRSPVYTPQFFVSGQALSSWRDSAAGLETAIAHIQSQPARAHLRLAVDASQSALMVIDAEAHAAPSEAPLLMYLALTENGLSNKIEAGENRGALLRHEHVVRAWLGPLALKQGELKVQRSLSLNPAWRKEQLSVVSLVQNSQTGEILQALSSATCGALN